MPRKAPRHDAMNDEYQTKIGSVRDMLDKMYKDINDKHKKLIAEQSKAYQAKDKHSHKLRISITYWRTFKKHNVQII